ncbi:MAG: MCE family protein [Betaproteobacteria bacterium]|nr:MCE family protein [Betaproteobacteria bacterium]
MDEPLPAGPPNERRALAMLAFSAMVIVAFVVYALHGRGAFEQTQRLVLMAEDGAGVSVGMDLTYAGFPVGRVQRIELDEGGKARIEIEVPRKDSKWLRASSVFTLERNLVGGARLRAFTGDLNDKPLPEGAVRPVLRGDATEELPAIVASLKRLLGNLERITAEDGNLDTSLANVRGLTARLSGPKGALGIALGGDAEAAKVISAIDRANALLASLEKLSTRLDGAVQKADAKLLGEGGVADEAKASLAQLKAAIADARESLKKVDLILADAQKIAGNAKSASQDLDVLRAEVDASLRKLNALVDDLNRRWPFSREKEVKLP